MAEEYKRQRARKLVTFPTGEQITIPVITRLNVLDQNGQEVEITVDNTSDNQTREVHVDQVQPSPSGSGTLAVERIDSWHGLDIVSQAQESQFIIDNKTGADTLPPSFTTHQKTHVYRYYQDPNNQDNSGVWLDSELIDEISVVDQNGQENIYFLDNPAAGDPAGQADSSDPIINGSAPYRTDPFQNIVNWHSGGQQFFQQIFIFRRYGSTCGAANTAAVEQSGGGDWYPVSHEQWLSWALPSTASEDGLTFPKEDPGFVGSSIILMPQIGSRHLLSELIDAFLSLSKQFGNAPSSLDGSDGINPWWYWITFSHGPQIDCSPGLIAPFDINQPSASNADQLLETPPGSGMWKPHWIYFGLVGAYSVDDTPTGGFDLSSVPPFVPPT